MRGRTVKTGTRRFVLFLLLVLCYETSAWAAGPTTATGTVSQPSPTTLNPVPIPPNAIQAGSTPVLTPTDVRSRFNEGLQRLEAALASLLKMPLPRACRTASEKRACKAVIAQIDSTVTEAGQMQFLLLECERTFCVSVKREERWPSGDCARLASVIRNVRVSMENVRNQRNALPHAPSAPIHVAFDNFDQKANQITSLLSSVMTAMKDTEQGIAKNIRQ